MNGHEYCGSNPVIFVDYQGEAQTDPNDVAAMVRAAGGSKEASQAVHRELQNLKNATGNCSTGDIQRTIKDIVGQGGKHLKQNSKEIIRAARKARQANRGGSCAVNVIFVLAAAEAGVVIGNEIYSAMDEHVQNLNKRNYYLMKKAYAMGMSVHMLRKATSILDELSPICCKNRCIDLKRPQGNPGVSKCIHEFIRYMDVAGRNFGYLTFGSYSRYGSYPMELTPSKMAHLTHHVAWGVKSLFSCIEGQCPETKLRLELGGVWKMKPKPKIYPKPTQRDKRGRLIPTGPKLVGSPAPPPVYKYGKREISN